MELKFLAIAKNFNYWVDSTLQQKTFQQVGRFFREQLLSFALIAA
jgi:hypothetical protein